MNSRENGIPCCIRRDASCGPLARVIWIGVAFCCGKSSSIAVRTPRPVCRIKQSRRAHRRGVASGKPGAWSRLSVVVSPEPDTPFGAQVGRNSLSEEFARQQGTAGRSADLGDVASRSGEQGRGQGEGDGAVPSA